MEMILILLFLSLGFLSVGSFLGTFSYRVTFDKNIFALRSRCPSCNSIISWYDNIPILSWFLLKGKCRSCKVNISSLYPFIEFLTLVVFYLVYCIVPMQYFLTYIFFFSAIICAIRSDLEAMVIPQIFTIYLVPVGFIMSYLGLTFVTLQESILGVLLGYGFLFLVAYVFEKVTGKAGLGVGDMELLAFIGSFFGPEGAWFSLMIGSCLALMVGGAYIVFTKQSKDTRIPFGPFISLGVVVYLIYLHLVTRV